MSTGVASALDLEAIAREVRAAQDSARSIVPFTSRLPSFGLADAYEVSRRVHGLRLAEGARPVGRKIGFTNYAMWTRFGVREPIWAYVYDRTVSSIGAIGAQCALGRFAEPRVEPEIVFHFRDTPRPGADAAEVLAAVDWIAHGFEIVQSHFPGWRFEAPDTVADASLHATLFVGPRQPVAKLGPQLAAALESFTLDLSCDGRLIETGKGANVLGSPLRAIVHLLSVLDSQCAEPLAAGELVTTGTITTALPVKAGESWTSRLQGLELPGLTLRFTP